LEMRIIAGILLIISFVCGLYSAVPALIAEDIASEAEELGMPSFVADIFLMCAVIIIIFAILALLGGVMAITGKSYGLAILGAVFALFTLGPFFLGSILGLVGLILIVLSADEFGKTPQAAVPPGGYVPPAMPVGMEPSLQPPAPPYGQPPMEQPPVEPPEQPPMGQPPEQPPMETPEEPPVEQAPAYQTPPVEGPEEPPEEPQP